MTCIFSKSSIFMHKIRILHIQDIKLDARPTRNLIKQLRRMKDLQELHLVNLVSLEDQMHEFAHSIQNLKCLHDLNLRQTTIRTRKLDALVQMLMNNKSINRLDISDSIISKKNMIHLWLALHKNISVSEVIYSRLNFFAIPEMGAIDLELKLNNVIQQ